MKQIDIINQGAGVFSIAGNLTFSGIDKKILKSFAFLTSTNAITLDLSNVDATDSAGLALIIEWIKYARQHQTELTFQNIPRQLLKLAKLSGLDQIEPFLLPNAQPKPASELNSDT